MRLGENDMRAIRYVMSAGRDGAIVTSTMIAEHLGITGPSVTKLLDRLEHAGHIRRERHPRDRRSLSIVVTDETRAGEGVRRRRSRAALRRRRRPLAGGAPGRDEVPQPARGPARRRAPCR
ncbi:MarR family transcriptional regulator [Agrococcus sp. Marseille-Q4369]|nr:MarR family transcriptional regulator [Agrococcus sp. Marseille-Q4369]